MICSFITADKAVGAAGFRIVWTEIKDGRGCDSSEEFLCQINGFCIDQSLRCNDVSNCGLDDNSDEINCELNQC